MQIDELKKLYEKNGATAVALSMGRAECSLIEIANVDVRLLKLKTHATSSEWYELLLNRPEVVHLCEPRMMDTFKWGMLVRVHPQVIHHVDITMFAPSLWEYMLYSSPRLVNYLKRHNIKGPPDYHLKPDDNVCPWSQLRDLTKQGK